MDPADRYRSGLQAMPIPPPLIAVVGHRTARTDLRDTIEAWRMPQAPTGLPGGFWRCRRVLPLRFQPGGINPDRGVVCCLAGATTHGALPVVLHHTGKMALDATIGHTPARSSGYRRQKHRKLPADTDHPTQQKSGPARQHKPCVPAHQHTQHLQPATKRHTTINNEQPANRHPNKPRFYQP